MNTSESKTQSSASGGAPKEGEPSEKSALGSFAKETRGLLSDLKEWVDIRVQLFQVEIEERIEEAFSKVLSAVAVAVLILFMVLFLMTALAEGVGTWLGHVAWGYLAVGLFFGVMALILNTFRPRLSLTSDESDKKPKKMLESAKQAPQITESAVSKTQTVEIDSQKASSETEITDNEMTENESK